MGGPDALAGGGDFDDESILLKTIISLKLQCKEHYGSVF